MSATYPLARANQKLDGFLAEGNLYFRVQDASGVYGPEVGPINGTTLSFNPGSGDQKNRVSKMIGTSGQLLNALITAGQPSVTFGFNDLGVEQFKLGVRGTSEAINEAGGSASAEVLTLPTNAKGGWIQLPDRNINSAAAFTLTGPSATPTYTFSANADADYGPINYKRGRVYIPAESTITIGDVEFSYTHFGLTGVRVKGNQIDQTIMFLYFEGKNKADLKDINATFWEAKVEPTQDVDLLGDDFAGAAFSGPLETPTGKDAPYEIEMDLDYATS